MFLRILLFLWVEIPHPPIPYGAARLFWYRSWVTHAQFMENSGQLYGIWLVAMDGDMLRIDELVYLYRLKASKEYGYYELVPWERSTRIVRRLPSSFRYWKSRFFFVSGDDFETPSGGVGVELPRLHRRWGTLTLGASMFFFIL